MDFEDALTGSRWAIIRALADGDASATDIATITGSSLPNISQQARLLEAGGIIKIRKEERRQVGKPRFFYRLSKETAHIALVRQGLAAKLTFHPDENQSLLLNLLLWKRQEDHFLLLNYLINHEEITTVAQGIAIVDSTSTELHLLVLAEPQELETLRTKHSKQAVTSPFSKKEKTVVCWTHSLEEVQQGLASEDPYFKKLLERHHVLIERHQVFRRVA